MCVDIKWILKLQTNKIKVLHIVSKNRIKNTSFVSKIKNKYLKINLHNIN